MPAPTVIHTKVGVSKYISCLLPYVSMGLSEAGMNSISSHLLCSIFFLILWTGPGISAYVYTKCPIEYWPFCRIKQMLCCAAKQVI